MRKILFRGKRLDNGEWVEGFYATNPEWDRRLYGEHHWIISCKNAIKYEIDPATVGQCTENTDDNGVMIFEGDIFDWGYAGVYDKRYVVTYNAETASFIGERGGGFVSLNGIAIKIIGNVHDNPELLEVGST